MVNTKVDGNGVERCQNVRDAAVENVKGDPSKGYSTAKVICNRPVTLSVSEKRKICPECDKQMPVGLPPNHRPRITNSAGVVLTAKELQECGVADGQDPSLKPAPVREKAPRKPREAKKPVEAKVKQVKDAVTFTVTLEQLEQGADIAGVLIKQAIDAMDKLPTPTLAESKRLIKLQERLQGLLEA